MTSEEIEKMKNCPYNDGYSCSKMCLTRCAKDDDNDLPNFNN